MVSSQSQGDLLRLRRHLRLRVRFLRPLALSSKALALFCAHQWLWAHSVACRWLKAVRKLRKGSLRAIYPARPLLELAFSAAACRCSQVAQPRRLVP